MSEMSMDPANNIQQIRDILLGQQIEYYDRQLRQCGDRAQRLQQQLRTFQTEFRQQVNQAQDQLVGHLRHLNQEAEENFQAFSDHSESELFQLREQIQSVEDQLSDRLEQVKDSLSQTLDHLAGDLNAMQNHVEQDIQTLRTDSFSSLDQLMDQLKDFKVTRSDLAEMFGDLSQTLRPSSFAAINPGPLRAELESE